jgi:hypothetical protein
MKEKTKNLILISILILGSIVMMIGDVKAEELFQFDNIKQYDAVTKEVTIINTFGLGQDIAKIKLNTDWCLNNYDCKINSENPTEVILSVGYQQIAELQINNFEDYNSIMDKMEIYNIKNTELTKTERQFDYKIKVQVPYEVNDYSDKQTCIEDIKFQNGTEICSYEIIGKHTEYKQDWIPLEKFDFLKGDIVTLGIFTQVYLGDNVEWIPTLYGKVIDDWASYVQSSGTQTFIDISGVNYTVLTFTSNGTFNVTGDILNISYLIIAGGGAGYSGGGGAGGLLFNDSYNISAGNYSVFVGKGGNNGTGGVNGRKGQDSSFNGITAYGGGLGGAVGSLATSGGSGGGDGANKVDLGGDGIAGQGYDGGTGRPTPYPAGGGGGSNGEGGSGIQANGTSGNGGDGRIININGTSVCWAGGGGGGRYNATIYGGYGGCGGGGLGTLDNNASGNAINGTGGCGGGGGGGSNGGSGGYGIVIIRFITSPIVTLNSPINYYNTSSPSAITFNATVTDNLLVQNVSLYLDNVLNQTNTSNVNGTYLFTATLGEGYHNWSILAYDNNSNPSQSENRYFNISFTNPKVVLISPTNYQNFTDPYINFNITVTDDYYVKNVSYYIDGTLWGTLFIEGLSNGTITFSEALSEGHHNWSILAYNIYSKYNQSETRELWINTTPQLTLDAPVNYANLSYNNVYFNSTVNAVYDIKNVTLYINGSQYAYNNTGISGNYVFLATLSDGYYYWSEKAWSSLDAYNQSETRELWINTTPQLTLDAPVNYANLSYNNVYFNSTVNAVYDIKNVTLYINGSQYAYNNTGISGNYVFLATLSDGYYYWSEKAWSSLDAYNQSETRYLTIDTLSPNITFQSPLSKYNYLRVGQIIALNFTATDVGGYLDNCTWNYNGTNYSANCQQGIQFNTSFAQELNRFNITVNVNDTFGNVNSSIKIWNIDFLETNKVYDLTALQTSIKSFIWVGIEDSSVTSSSATLTYNGSTYTSIQTTSGDYVNFSNSVAIPTTVSGNVSFYWTITFTNSTGTFSFNTTLGYQQVSNLTISQCFSPSTSGLTLNFTTYDSTNMTVLNSTFEVNFKIYSGTSSTAVSFLFSDLNENRSNYMFCLNSSGQNVSLDAFISYGAANYDTREYIIDGGIIGNFTQDIPLYLTETALTDIVTVLVQDQSYNKISGALVAIQRWNIGTNTYSTIGMLTTSSTGQGIIDLELYTTWYRAVVAIDGVIVEVTDVQKLSSTSWIITVNLVVTNPYDLFGSISHGLTFDNATNITSFTFIDSSGFSNRGCLVIQNRTTLGPITIEDECVTSVSGTINYLLSGNGYYTAYGVIFLQGYNTSQIVDTLDIRLGTPGNIETISPHGKVISFLVIGTLGLIGVSAGSIILGAGLIIIGLISLMYFGFLNITAGFIWGIVSILIIAVILQRRKK